MDGLLSLLYGTLVILNRLSLLFRHMQVELGSVTLTTTVVWVCPALSVWLLWHAALLCSS